MALIKNNLYVRVEQIELGKNLMRFNVCEYTDVTKVPVNHWVEVAPFVYSKNPFEEAYEFLKNKFSDMKDEVIAPVVVEEPKVAKKPATKSKKATKE